MIFCQRKNQRIFCKVVWVRQLSARALSWLNGAVILRFASGPWNPQPKTVGTGSIPSWVNLWAYLQVDKLYGRRYDSVSDLVSFHLRSNLLRWRLASIASSESHLVTALGGRRSRVRMDATSSNVDVTTRSICSANDSASPAGDWYREDWRSLDSKSAGSMFLISRYVNLTGRRDDPGELMSSDARMSWWSETRPESMTRTSRMIDGWSVIIRSRMWSGPVRVGALTCCSNPSVSITSRSPGLIEMASDPGAFKSPHMRRWSDDDAEMVEMTSWNSS